jgi:hypothetical protein
LQTLTKESIQIKNFIMKKNVLYYLATILALISFGSWVLYPSGSPGGKTGSPGDVGVTCAQCHTGTPQQAEGWVTSDIPVDGYLPGETYTITTMGDHSGVSLFGFETTAEDASGAKKGTFIITDAAQTKLINGNKAVTHTSGGTTPSGNTKTWSFEWTAPEAGTGDVTFYAALNAANGNGSTSGDVIYLSSSTFQENTGVGIDEDLAAAARLKVFPNPATDFSDITWNGSTHAAREIRLFNLAGNMIASYEITDSKSGRFRLSVAELPTGMYFVQTLFDNGGLVSSSLVRR